MAAVQSAAIPSHSSHIPDPLARYRCVRSTTTALCAPLATEDYVAQSMPDASPTKWHLAHTTWFFEEFVLKAFAPGYRPFHPQFAYLFNSYYQSVGAMHDRPRRGLLTRPTVAEVRDYRDHVDQQMELLLAQRGDDERLDALTTLGLNHEQQHQELLLTDLKHLYSCNPLQPAYRTREISQSLWSAPLKFVAVAGGVREIGASGKHFSFDNETPRHRVLVEPYALADRLVTNGEYLEFVREGGYRRHDLWLADAWSLVNSEGWLRPLYWSTSLDSEFTLNGLRELDLSAPVAHLSYYEADAFARWAGARLPTEAEWELAAAAAPVAGNLLDSGVLQPIGADDGAGFKQFFGDVWEWTSSPYAAYPGYRPPAGALGEYNGKFMCSQLVLRGGSCATPADHVRATYRNFFYPHARWQFSGVRLARDL
jgi:ergothioneine biosynthesis protein EgtB